MKNFSSNVRYLNSIRNFNEIPGLLSLPIIGTLWNYLPGFGKYKFNRLRLNGASKYRDFGKIVKEEIVPGVNIVWIFTPEDVQELFSKEGRYPERRSHLALEKHRKDRSDIYNNGGLLPTNGPEWWKIRRIFQKGLSSPQNVKVYLPVVNDVIDEYLNFLEKEHVKTEDFEPSLSRLYLELIGIVAFDTRLNSFHESQKIPHSKPNLLMKAAMTTNSCILKTDNGLQLWKKFNTPLYRRLKQSHEFMENVAIELVQKKMNAPTDSANCNLHGNSLLDNYLNSPEIDFKDIIGMAVDMILAGIDTTTYTTSFLLYHLSKNLKVQEKLYQESKVLLPQAETPVDSEILSKATYLKAVLKETFRLNPISVGIGRVLAEDAVFSGYHVPKKTVVVTQNEVVCRFENYFKNASSFMPERWIKQDVNYQQVSPYLVLPFGHGPRTCIARRLAEQNIQTFILKLCRKYEMKWCGTDIDSESLLINKPDGPVLLSFHKHEE